MKPLILVFCCLLLLAPCQAAENQLKPEEIDSYISQLRCNIESYYDGQMVELHQRAESEIRLLEVADGADDTSLAAQAESVFCAFATTFFTIFLRVFECVFQ